jgi:hypothetical protein
MCFVLAAATAESTNQQYRLSPNDNCTIHSSLYLGQRLCSLFSVNRRHQHQVLISWGRWIPSDVLARKLNDTFCSYVFTNERTVTRNDLTFPSLCPVLAAVTQSVRFGEHRFRYKNLYNDVIINAELSRLWPT